MLLRTGKREIENYLSFLGSIPQKLNIHTHYKAVKTLYLTQIKFNIKPN